MTKKLVRISLETYKSLQEMGRMDDTFDSVISKLMKERRNTKQTHGNGGLEQI